MLDSLTSYLWSALRDRLPASQHHSESHVLMDPCRPRRASRRASRSVSTLTDSSESCVQLLSFFAPICLRKQELHMQASARPRAASFRCAACLRRLSSMSLRQQTASDSSSSRAGWVFCAGTRLDRNHAWDPARFESRRALPAFFSLFSAAGLPSRRRGHGDARALGERHSISVKEALLRRELITRCVARTRRISIGGRDALGWVPKREIPAVISSSFDLSPTLLLVRHQIGKVAQVCCRSAGGGWDCTVRKYYWS